MPLEVGQVRHVQTPGPLLGTPGTTFFVLFMLHPSTPGAAPIIDVYSWILETLTMAPGVTISLSQRPTRTTHTHVDLYPTHCESRLLQVTPLNSASFRSQTCRNDHTDLSGKAVSSPTSPEHTPPGSGGPPSLLSKHPLMKGRVTALSLVMSLLVTLTLSSQCKLLLLPTPTPYWVASLTITRGTVHSALHQFLLTYTAPILLPHAALRAYFSSRFLSPQHGCKHLCASQI